MSRLSSQSREKCMSQINELIAINGRRAFTEGLNTERDKLWTLIELDVLIPAEVKARIRNLFYGIEEK
jgi:hypothetical protein